MDFMSDQLWNGKSFRTFNILDAFNCEGLGIDVDFSLPVAQVVRSLSQVIAWRAHPVGQQASHNVSYIQPGKQQQNAYIELYNRTVPNEWLGTHIFHSVQEVQDHATQWLWTYNNDRPNWA